MGVTDTVRDTAGSVAGAGADILLAGGRGAAKLLRDTWSGPPIRIPRVVRVSPPVNVTGKATPAQILAARAPRPAVVYYEIPPAVFMVAVGALLAYGWLRTKGVSPFDWAWAELEKARAAAGAASDVGAGIPTETAVPDGRVIATRYEVRVTQGGRQIGSYQGTDLNAVVAEAVAAKADGTQGALYYSVDEGVSWRKVGNGSLW